MSATENFLESVCHALFDTVGTIDEKAARIVQLVNDLYPHATPALKRAVGEGNHYVTLAPITIHRLRGHVPEGYQITEIKLAGVYFTNGEQWIPEREVDLLWQDPCFTKLTQAVELKGIHGEFKIKGANRSTPSMNIRYEPYDSNSRVDIAGFQIRLFYVATPVLQLE